MAGEVTRLSLTDLRSKELDLSHHNQEHPLRRQEIVQIIERDFPQLLERVAAITIPQQSDQPNELEIWEAAQIIKRRDRMKILNDRGELFWEETHEDQLLRCLYEEFFSVNQTPGDQNGPVKDGIKGMVPGGLVSHFLDMSIINGVSFESIAQSDLQASSLRELIAGFDHVEGGWWKSTNLINFFIELSMKGYYSRPRAKLVSKNLMDGKNTWPEIESIGFRLAWMMKTEPFFLQPVESEELQAIIKATYPISRAMFIKTIWQRFSGRLISPNGTFKSYTEPGVKDAVAELLFIRTHPEMQKLFKYLSPSGYINQAKLESVAQTADT